MKESEIIKNYHSRVKEIVNQIRAYGENVLDKRIIEKILNSVTRKYDTIITTIEQTKDLSTLSVIEIVGSLEAYEQRLSRLKFQSQKQIFARRNYNVPKNSRSKENFGDSSKRNFQKENFRKSSRSNYQRENSRDFSRSVLHVTFVI